MIDVGQATGHTTVINIDSSSTVAPSTYEDDDTDLVIASHGTTGSVLVNNAGTLNGTFDFSSLTDATGSVVINNSGDIQTDGNSTFGGQASSAANAINNSGYIDIDEGAIFTGLGQFNNLATGELDLRNGDTGVLSSAGTAYAGTAGSRIDVDTFLGAPGSPSDHLNVGSTSGTSSIAVTDTSSGPGAYVPPSNGIVLVHTSGTNGATFTLDPDSSHYTTFYGPAALQKGLWLYTIDNQPNETILTSVPGPEAYHFPQAITAAQNVWYANAPWQDRQADLRDDQLTMTDPPTYEPGVWLKAVGDWASRSGTVSPGLGFRYDTGYNQDTYGIIGGVDVDRHSLFQGRRHRTDRDRGRLPSTPTSTCHELPVPVSQVPGV